MISMEGAELLVAPEATGAFMKVVEAIRQAPYLLALPADAWAPLPEESRRVAPGIDDLSAAADTLGLTPNSARPRAYVTPDPERRSKRRPGHDRGQDHEQDREQDREQGGEAR